MPFAVLTAGGGYKWIQLHGAENKQDIKTQTIRHKNHFLRLKKMQLLTHHTSVLKRDLLQGLVDS